jgi:hypothetical protein
LKPKSINGKYGYINKHGKIVIGPKWDRAEEFYEGMAFVTIDKLVGLIDRDGNEIVSPKYNHALYGEYTGQAKALYPVQFDNKWGYVSSPDKITIPFI